jgi:predicted AAA+ superfamily ATPase
MFFHRSLTGQLEKALLHSGKIILLYGARQTGKTTLINEVINQLPYRTLSINADEIRYLDALSSRDSHTFRLLTEGYDLLFIDEAQRIPDAGINLKILHDSLPELKIIITGSSSLELAGKTKEALTGRLESYLLYPVSWMELTGVFHEFELTSRLEEFLIFGTYPEILTTGNSEEKQKKLLELTSSYLFKDILELSGIRHSRKLINLLRLLSFQLGSQVSLSELGGSLGMSKETVGSYIDLLEKAFVLFRVGGFSRNLRKEVTKMDKYYFYDLGIRNAVINNFAPLHMRNDLGQLWENFLVMERVKYQHYSQKYVNLYYWRTYTGAEIDLIEEYGGTLNAYEFKYGEGTVKVPVSWSNTYPGASFSVIHSGNFRQFIS